MALEPTIEYQRLSVLKAEIRLLNIAPLASDGDSDDTVQCTLEHVPLGNPPPYVALSYCWGSTANTAEIRVWSESQCHRESGNSLAKISK